MVMESGAQITLVFKTKPTEAEIELFIATTLKVYNSYCGTCQCINDQLDEDYENDNKRQSTQRFHCQERNINCHLTQVKSLIQNGSCRTTQYHDEFNMLPVSIQFPNVEFIITCDPYEGWNTKSTICYNDGKIISGRIGKMQRIWYDAVTNLKLN